MISFLSGTVRHVEQQSITIDAHAIGFLLYVPTTMPYAVGSNVQIHVHMHWNQEQGPTLYGFQSDLEKQAFLLITSCSGIGPKIGLAVLADLGAERFIESVHAQDERALSKVSGIGAKKAEQIIVQLRHKVAKLVSSGIELAGAAHLTDWQTVTEALESLNYSRAEITRAMTHLKKEYGGTNPSFDQLMRNALSFLSQQQ